jgi:hypothetical protein
MLRYGFELTLYGGKDLSSLAAFLTDNGNELKDLDQVTAGKDGTWESTVPAKSIVSLWGCRCSEGGRVRTIIGIILVK